MTNDEQAADNGTAGIDFSMDKKNLYLEETFSDLKMGSIRRLTPVKPDGSVDKGRKTLFLGQTSLVTPQGMVPIQAAIHASDIQQALKRYPEAMKEAMGKLVEEVDKLRREQQNRIIAPSKEQSRIILPGR